MFTFLLNVPWEFLQVPLYVGMTSMPHWTAVQACMQAAAGDAVIGLTAYWVVALWQRRRGWLRRYGHKECVVFVLTGLLITVGLEWHATVITLRWTYAPVMPTLPWLGTGLMPLLQWLTLPPLILWISSRHFIGTLALMKGADCPLGYTRVIG
ncbi:hypothetical protein [Halomonas sp. NO4]|uniref:hypothetical protein n=1 Tax=Halomonas sp. NO4 TaxID=2484813 RepID=UPI001969FD01|nr:hypothetical protein [Halomonas sp. NO4]